MGENEDKLEILEAEAGALAGESIALHEAGDYDAADRALDESQRLSPSHHVAPVAPYEFKRELAHSPAAGPLNLLNYARRNLPDREVFAQYYPFRVDGQTFLEGQRKPEDRLQYLPNAFFFNRTVLDIGGNFGGMLHARGSELKWGVGTDYDPRMVNAATRIWRMRGGLGHLDFYVHDLDEDPLELLLDFLPEPRVDVVLLLAVCAHIKKWREVIAFTATISSELVFEANGYEYEQLGQLRALERAYDTVKELAPRGAPGIGSRRLLLCRAGKK